MADPKTYHIETVADFLKVPEDRLEYCLSEFLTVLRAFRDFEALIGHELVPAFTWIDDREQHLTVQVNVREPTPTKKKDTDRDQGQG
jgi:hypothetical protein